MKDIKEFKNKYGLSGLHSQPTGYMNFEDKTEEVFKDVELLINETREETIMEEISYWKDVFDNRPKDRDLESDNIAQNFARIEIERLENKLKK